MVSLESCSKNFVHAQSHSSLCDPLDCSLPGYNFRQEYWSGWVAIFFSRGFSQLRDGTRISYFCVGKHILSTDLHNMQWLPKWNSDEMKWPLATPWTAAHQAPPSMGFSRQECWSGVPLPSPIINNKTTQKHDRKSKLQIFWILIQKSTTKNLANQIQQRRKSILQHEQEGFG